MSDDTVMLDAILATNRATENGGAIVFDEGGYASNVVLRGNRALDSGGGAMLYFGGELHDCLIEQNTAAWGGGLQCNGNADHGYVLGCTIRSNTVPNGGGGVRYWLGGIVRDCVIAYNRAKDGGGVEITGGTGWVDRCWIRHNVASNSGGGVNFVDHGLVTGCTIVSNTAAGYGGGGAYLTAGGHIDRSRILFNSAASYGGACFASFGGSIHNSLMAFNFALRGGAVFADGGGLFVNCTIVSNTASFDTGGAWNDRGGGWYTNCVLYHNTAPAIPNHTSAVAGATFTRCCAWPLPPGTGNFTNAPMLSAALTNFGVPLAGSPCINVATTLPWMAGANDAYGVKRIVGPAADVGACEYPYTTSGVSAIWLAEHSLFTDGSADFLDTDGDSIINRDEWLCGTDPRGNDSFLGLQAAPRSSAGFVIAWHSVDGKRYAVARGTNAVRGDWTPIVTNVLGIEPANSATDTTAVGSGPWFYRVNLE